MRLSLQHLQHQASPLLRVYIHLKTVCAAAANLYEGCLHFELLLFLLLLHLLHLLLLLLLPQVLCALHLGCRRSFWCWLQQLLLRLTELQQVEQLAAVGEMFIRTEYYLLLPWLTLLQQHEQQLLLRTQQQERLLEYDGKRYKNEYKRMYLD